MSRQIVLATVMLVPLLAACGSDGGGLRCSLSEATLLDESDSNWPSARNDPANTARFANGALSESKPPSRCIFPLSDDATTSGQAASAACEPGGSPISTTVIVSDQADEEEGTDVRLTVGTQDGVIRQINADALDVRPLERGITLPASPTTPLIGQDGSIFVTDTSGVTRRFSNVDGEQEFSAPLLNQIVVDLNMGPDGVVYTGTRTGLFRAICPNGGFRFSAGLGSISTPVAITDHPSEEDESIVLVASDTGRVTALEDQNGRRLWTFFTSGRLDESGIVIDKEMKIFIVPDSQSQIFAGSLATGRPEIEDEDGGRVELKSYRVARCAASGDACRLDAECGAGDTCMSDTISAAGALGENHFYIATEGIRRDNGTVLSPGALYAFSLDFAGGGPDWVWTLPDGGSVQSAPIVVAQGGAEIVVFGADVECVDTPEDTPCSTATLFAVRDDGQLLWEVNDLAGSVGRLSPSIRNTADGSRIYIGTSAGMVFEIG